MVVFFKEFLFQILSIFTISLIFSFCSKKTQTTTPANNTPAKIRKKQPNRTPARKAQSFPDAHMTYRDEKKQRRMRNVSLRTPKSPISNDEKSTLNVNYLQERKVLAHSPTSTAASTEQSPTDSKQETFVVEKKANGNQKKNMAKPPFVEAHSKDLYGPANQDEVKTPVNTNYPYLPFDKTVYENVYHPAVHGRSMESASNGLIVDPRNTKYLGNVDRAFQQEREKRYLKFQEELAQSENENSTQQQTIDDAARKVTIREDKCVVYETNDAQTYDEDNYKNQSDCSL